MQKVLVLLVLALCVVAVSVVAAVAQTDTEVQAMGAAEIRALAEKGNAEAQFRLGRMYMRGEGAPQDDVQAVAWYRKAAEQGHAKAQNNLGVMYSLGEGVPQDWEQSMIWIRKAADLGEAIAQFNLGFRYRSGQGVSQDYEQAATWYRKAAEQGHVEAQFYLALAYAEGQGMPRDYAQGSAWYRKAADQGYAPAQYNLGLLYGGGRGVPQEVVEAHKWLTLAAGAATGEELKIFTDGRDSLAKSLEPAQIVEAERRAKEWTDMFALRQKALATVKAAGPALQLADVAIAPRAVRPGMPLSLAIGYTASDPAAASGKVAVTMSFSILSGGTSLLEVPGESVESTSGQPWKITKPLTAATTPGSYVIRVRLVLGTIVVARDVEFEITR